MISKNNNWEIGNEMYINEFTNEIKEKYYYNKNNSPDYVGLIFPSNTKNKKKYTFKIKDMLDLKSQSGICLTNFPKNTRKNILKYCLGDDMYEKIKKQIELLNSSSVCLLIEMVLRYNNLNNIKSKRWFLNLEESIYNKKNHKILKF